MAFKTLIGFDNIVDEDAGDDYSIAITSGGGSITSEVGHSNLFSRSVTDAVTFNKSVGGDVIELDFTFNDSVIIKLISILGFSNEFDVTSVTFKNGGVLVTSLTNDQGINNTRWVTDKFLKDYVYTWDNNITVDQVIIEFDVSSSALDLRFGSFYAGDKLSIDIEPKLVYTTQDFSKKDRTNGGLVISNQYSTVRSVKFKSTVIATPTMFAITSNSPTLLNAKAGASEPIIFIPMAQNNTIIYGSQKKPCVITQVLGKDNANEWFWAASFEIEEEL